MIIFDLNLKANKPEYWAVNIFTNVRTKYNRELKWIDLEYHIIDVCKDRNIYEYIYDYKYSKNENLLRTILFKTPIHEHSKVYIVNDIINYINPNNVCLLFVNDMMGYIIKQVDKLIRDNNMGLKWRNYIYKFLASNEYLDYNFWINILTHASNTNEILKNLFTYSKYSVKIYKWCCNPTHWCDPYDVCAAILENKYIDGKLFKTILFGSTDVPIPNLRITEYMNKTYLYDNLEQINKVYGEDIYWQTKAVIAKNENQIYECINGAETMDPISKVIIYKHILQQLFTVSEYYPLYETHATLLIFHIYEDISDIYSSIYIDIIEIDGLTRDAIKYLLDVYGNNIAELLANPLNDTMSKLLKQKNIYKSDLDLIISKCIKHKISYRNIDMYNILNNPNLIMEFDIATVFNIYGEIEDLLESPNNSAFLAHELITTKMLEYITPKILNKSNGDPNIHNKLNHMLCNPNIIPVLFEVIIAKNIRYTGYNWWRIFKNTKHIPNKQIIKWFNRFTKYNNRFNLIYTK
jgi:hypothetical protein